jgi:hypothetical protein
MLLANAQEDSDVPMVSPDQADDWLTRHDFVLCYEAPDGQAYVYPFKIMNFHEIVNEEFDGVSVLSTTPTW